MPSKSSKSSPELKLFSILDSLPCVNTKLNNVLDKYHCVKHSSILSAVVLWSFESVLKVWCSLGLFALVSLPTAVLNAAPVQIADKLICHQLEFVEQQLSTKTGTEYKPQSSSFKRCIKLFSLGFRLLFILPRISASLFLAIWHVITNEFKEDSKLAMEIFSNKSSLARRTTTRISRKRQSSSPCKRKRVLEEDIEEKVEQYLFVNESYQSENDPDYEIGETTCEFDDSTGESEMDDDEAVDSKGFLCEQCKDDCDDKCNATREIDCDDGLRDSDDDSDDGVSSESDEFEKKKQENFDDNENEEDFDKKVNNGSHFVGNSDAVEEILPSVTPYVNVKVFKKLAGQKVEIADPVCQKG